MKEYTAFKMPPGNEATQAKLTAQFSYKVGEVFRIPISKLQATEDSYTIRALNYSTDKLTISRVDGTFVYDGVVRGVGKGNCELEKTKF